MSSLTKIPAGVQYFFDDDVRLRRYVERTAMETFAGWSYDEILLPMFDYQDLFARGMGQEKAARTYRFVDRDGALLALRPELTSLVARTVATRFQNKQRPIRLSYSGEVFRYDEPTERAAREFHQLGLEYIGEPSIVADIEVLLIAAEALATLGLNGFRIALSHVDFFNGVADFLQLAGPDRSRLRELIGRRNSLALDAFLAEKASQVEESRRRGFSRLVQVAGKEEAIESAREILLNEKSREAIEHLSRIYSVLSSLGLGKHFDLDLGEAGGLEYYTGLTFKVYLPEWGVEVGGGGRYDNLIANFGPAEPAVGFSFALDALAGAIARQRGKEFISHPGEAQVIGIEQDLARTFAEARDLRSREKKVKIGGQ
jgi:ATP phosphoribosyltransferase regulatory subunit